MRKEITCPVCGNKNPADMNYCSVCSWSFPEDCTWNGTLFAGKQLEEYQARVRIMKKLVNEGSEKANARIRELESANKELESANKALKNANDRLKTTGEKKIESLFSEPKKPVITPTVKHYSVPKSADDPVNRRLGVRANLWPYSMDEICRRIADGSFEGLYVGDWIEIDGTRYILAGFDCLLEGYKGVDGKFRDHFAVVVPESIMGLSRMYTIDSDNKYKNQSGNQAYKESQLYRFALPRLAGGLQSGFNNHILSKTGENTLELLNKNQVFGTDNIKEQLPLFRLYPDTKVAKELRASLYNPKGSWYWLQDQVENGRFAACSPTGTLSDLASHADNVGIRPYFCIG